MGVLVAFRHVFCTEYFRKRPVFVGSEKRKRQISHSLVEFVSQNRILGRSVRFSQPVRASAPQQAPFALEKTDLFLGMVMGRIGAPRLLHAHDG